MIFPILLGASDVSGIIKNNLNKNPLDNAIVKLIKIADNNVTQTVITNKKGEYYIGNIDPGIYQIIVSKPYFYKNILFDFAIEPMQNYDCNIDLLQKTDIRKGRGKRKIHNNNDESSDYCFMIGSIEVKSHGEELIPEEAVTTRKITSGEIEHMQATSLGDVLNLIPGIEKTQNPGLSNASRVGIRATTISGTEGMLETFGISIIIDENEISTSVNANSNSGRGGLDLRTIPADNIESVEVISGIPSAEYGNFSNGIIKVKTKSGSVQNKIKAKINPDTKTASYSGGHKFSKSFIDYHLNYGFSERDLRLVGDEYHRIYGKLSYDRPFINEKLKTKSIITFTKTYDSDAPVGIYEFVDYSEGYKTSASFNFNYNKTESSSYRGLFNINLNRKKDFNEKLVSDPIYFDSTTYYTYENHTYNDTLVPIYIGKKRDKGYEININTNLKYNWKFNIGKQDHDFLTGFIGKFEQNIGEGVVLDSVFHYYGVASSKRSYAYDEYGKINQYNFFIQDKIQGLLFSKKYNLMLGLRYTAINPESIDLKNGFFKTRHGEFFSPRFNFQYFINKNLRCRIGAGKSVRSISLAHIYKEPAYYKYVDDSGSLIVDIEKQNNLNLQAYSTTKYEASIDWKPIKLLGLSLTGYYSNSDDMPKARMYPFGYSVNSDTLTAAKYSFYENIGWKDSYGVEFVLRTKRIHNLQFKMNITYRYSETSKSVNTYDDKPNSDLGETAWYKTPTYWKEKVIVDYQLNYISQRLGAWITLDIQYIPVYNKQAVYNSVEYEKDINGENYIFHQGQSEWYDIFEYDFGGKWLYNLRITKSLSQKTELSLYINNLLDDRALWNHPYYNSGDQELNPEIYYGLEVSTQW